jgi:hypothetical protein
VIVSGSSVSASELGLEATPWMQPYNRPRRADRVPYHITSRTPRVGNPVAAANRVNVEADLGRVLSAAHLKL